MLDHMTAESLSATFLLRSLTTNEHHPHLLLDCSKVEVECILLGLRQWGRSPLTHCRLPGPLIVPRARSGTLLLEGVQFLNRAQQIALYDWMATQSSQLQIISIATRELDSLVAQGLFLEGLFFRLNVVRLDIRAHDEPVSQMDEATS